jgi:hypothetical protein
MPTPALQRVARSRLLLSTICSRRSRARVRVGSTSNRNWPRFIPLWKNLNRNHELEIGSVWESLRLTSYLVPQHKLPGDPPPPPPRAPNRPLFSSHNRCHRWLTSVTSRTPPLGLALLKAAEAALPHALAGGPPEHRRAWRRRSHRHEEELLLPGAHRPLGEAACHHHFDFHHSSSLLVKRSPTSATLVKNWQWRRHTSMF